jgi:hypothetical protein
MGFTGAITFMKHDPRSVEWLTKEITLPWSNQEDPGHSAGSYRGDFGLKGVALDFNIPQNEDSTVKQHHIVYEDEERMKGRSLKCLVVGRMKMGGRSREQVRNYVLIITEIDKAGSVYERVGAGFLHGSMVDFRNPLSVRIE